METEPKILTLKEKKEAAQLEAAHYMYMARNIDKESITTTRTGTMTHSIRFVSPMEYKDKIVPVRFITHYSLAELKVAIPDTGVEVNTHWFFERIQPGIFGPLSEEQSTSFNDFSTEFLNNELMRKSIYAYLAVKINEYTF